MDAELKFGNSGADWTFVSETLKRVGMAHHSPEGHQQAFEASHTTVFAFSGGKMVGFGRAISDGIYQAALYDVAVVPECQGKGIGAQIVKALLFRVPTCNVILYASPGKEGFYETLGLRKMKTGLALFQNAEAMATRGFTE
jgi:ribosomal protein S18 acetylase RimI-like enzyme